MSLTFSNHSCRILFVFCMTTDSIELNSIDHRKKKCHSVFRWMKLLFALATPLAVGIFTIVTTIHNQRIAELDRNQDHEQTKDDQQETVYTNYINDISKFVNEKTYTDKNGLYIRTKTLAALRKLDSERKKQMLLFLKDSELLDTAYFSLSGSDFSEIHLNGNEIFQCQFLRSSFYQMNFHRSSFINCYFHRVQFQESDFREVQFINCSFNYCQFDQINFQNFILKNSYIRNSSWIDSSLMNSDLTGTSFIETNFINSNLFEAILPDQQSISIQNSILPNGVFSSIEESNQINDCQRKPLTNSFIQNFTSNTCAFISTQTEHRLDISLSNHLLLIKYNQASFIFSIRIYNSTQSVNTTLIFWNNEGLIDKMYSIGKLIYLLDEIFFYCL